MVNRQVSAAQCSSASPSYCARGSRSETKDRTTRKAQAATLPEPVRAAAEDPSQISHLTPQLSAGETNHFFRACCMLLLQSLWFLPPACSQISPATLLSRTLPLPAAPLPCQRQPDGCPFVALLPRVAPAAGLKTPSRVQGF